MIFLPLMSYTHSQILLRGGSNMSNKSTDITKLDPKQQRFIHLFLTGQYTNSKLAKLLDVHPNTIGNWLRKPEIQQLIKEHQQTEHIVVTTALKGLTMPAVQKLSELVNSPIDGVALQAVKDVLDRGGHKSKQEIKKEVTVKTFEQKMEELIEDTIDVDYEVVDDDECGDDE